MAIKETVFILCLVLLPLIMEAKQPKEPTKDKKSFVELFADPSANCYCSCKLREKLLMTIEFVFVLYIFIIHLIQYSILHYIAFYIMILTEALHLS